MRFRDTPLAGVHLLELEPHRDERGYFARSFCRRELEEHGLDPAVAQRSVSLNERAGTLRGLHFQWPPGREAKLVRVVRGALFDVLADLRPDSETFGETWSTTLRAGDLRQLWIPHGVAHGFLTREPETEIDYQMTAPYAPGLDGGYRWSSPVLGIDWPDEPAVISERDAALPDLDLEGHAERWRRAAEAGTCEAES